MVLGVGWEVWLARLQGPLVGNEGKELCKELYEKKKINVYLVVEKRPRYVLLFVSMLLHRAKCYNSR